MLQPVARDLSISVVIPALNEARRIGEVVRHALSLGDVEVVVADGGSSDDTARLAREAGARVVHAPPGRGPSLDAGASAATGDVLLFLHADTHLPDDAIDHVRATLHDPRVIGGNFYLRFVPYTPAGLAFTAWAHLRRSLWHAYGGQSAIFVRRGVFEELGGYGDLPLLEDRIFARRLEEAGRTRHLPTWAETSSRRFLGREWKALGVWAAVGSLHWLGVPPRWFVSLYRDIRD
jgi:glycosyltransferase involved in cell wall biosynthesis